MQVNVCDFSQWDPRREPEPLNLAGIGKGIAGLVAGLVGSQVASGVLGGSDTAQRDLT
jgi:hypothetical protein